MAGRFESDVVSDSDKREFNIHDVAAVFESDVVSDSDKRLK